MTWAVPRTYVTGEIMRARYLNQDLRDSVKAAVGLFDFVEEQEVTTSSSFTELVTSGPQVSVPVVDALTVFFGAYMFCATTAGIAIMGFDVTDGDGNLTAATDDHSCIRHVQTINRATALMSGHKLTGLAGGTATFTAKYRSSGGTVEAAFARRWVLAYGVGPAT